MGNTETKNLPAYVNSLDKYQNTIDSFDGIQIKSSISNRSFDLTTDVRTRPEFTKADYDYWRPSEAIPSRFPDIIKACRSLYQKSGIVRNVIDLMVDFIHEDVKVIHSDPDVQLFFKVWMSKVGMSDVIREYAKHLLIDHNVVVKRITGTLTQPVQRKWLQSIYASDLGSLKTADIPKVLDAREIPLRYVFL